MRNAEHGCREYVELIMQHLDGLLPPARSAELETHLAACAVCRAELLLQERIHDALTEEIHPRLSVDFTRLVTQKAIEAVGPVRRRSLWLSLTPAFALLAVTSLVFALPNDFRTMFARILGPTGSALASAAGSVGEVLAPDLHLSQLSVISGPFMLSLLLLVCVLPVVWCFRRVGQFLRQ